jgi:YD repeat-containing protein
VLNGKRIEIESVADEGQIITYELYSDKPKARRKQVFVQKGESGTPISYRKWEYEEKKNGEKKKFYISKIIDFVDENGEKPIETSYQYYLFDKSAKVNQKKTNLPIVPESENGDGKQISVDEVFDVHHRVVWSKNELGIISHYVYDVISKRLTRQIDDVDTTKISDFGVSLPDGWKTPDEAGKHDVTDYCYDFKGRLVKTVRPESEGIDETGQLVRCRSVTWNVYNDLHRTQHSATGYLEIDDTGNILRTVFANPVSITILNAAGQVTDLIQASRKNLDGELLATDEFEQDSYLSWTKHIYRFGKLIATRQYHEIPESGEGVKETHFAETLYDYDLQGRRIRTVSPLGAISRTVYDSVGNVVQQWVGTNDTGATETDPHGNNPENDMRLVSETMYGHNGSCSSCGGGNGDRVLVQVQHVGEGKIRTTEFKYDWRGRQTHTLAEEDENGNYIQTVQHYDNLDRIVKMEQYLCNERHNEKKSTKKTNKIKHI